MKILLSSAKTIALFTEAFQVASEATNYSRDGEGMPIKKNAVKITDTIKMYSGFGAAFQAEIIKMKIAILIAINLILLSRLMTKNTLPATLHWYLTISRRKSYLLNII